MEYSRYSYEICRYHHERYDGRGYPDGLKGDDIPISAQLVSVADVYDALVNERVYKDAIPKDQAFQMITQGECGVFSPKLLEAFRKVRREFESLVEKQAAEASA
jgi:putative two-component system response regulator